MTVSSDQRKKTKAIPLSENFQSRALTKRLLHKTAMERTEIIRTRKAIHHPSMKLSGTRAFADNCSIQADESDTNRIAIPERRNPHLPPIVRVYVIGIVIPVMLYAMFTTRFLCPSSTYKPIPITTKYPCLCVWCRQVQHLRPSWGYWIILIIIGAVPFG